jgi:CHASE3 domain sensor protein
MVDHLMELHQRAAEIATEIAAAEQQLRAALLAGEPTTPAREYLKAIRTEEVEAAAAMRDAQARAEADAEAALAAAGNVIADVVLARLAAARAALTVPSRPQRSAT